MKTALSCLEVYRMKFVYNEEKNLEMRNILMMQPTLEEADAVVKSIDFIEGYGWTITFE